MYDYHSYIHLFIGVLLLNLTLIEDKEKIIEKLGIQVNDVILTVCHAQYFNTIVNCFVCSK